MNRSDVLIIGAGPTGLVLALWLSKLGIRVRIIDKTSEPGTTSRALAVQARTLELYRQLDLSDTVVQNGHKVAAANFWVKGEPVARLPLSTIGEGLTPYAFLEMYPQDEHERLLIERLEAFGITVERNTELQSFEETGDGITARLRLPDGQQETCQACYLAGCDGARSIVRKTLDTGFSGRHLPADFSTWLMCKLAAPRSTVNCMWTLMKPTSSPYFPWLAKVAPA